MHYQVPALLSPASEQLQNGPGPRGFLLPRAACTAAGRSACPPQFLRPTHHPDDAQNPSPSDQQPSRRCTWSGGCSRRRRTCSGRRRARRRRGWPRCCSSRGPDPGGCGWGGRPRARRWQPGCGGSRRGRASWSRSQRCSCWPERGRSASPSYAGGRGGPRSGRRR